MSYNPPPYSQVAYGVPQQQQNPYMQQQPAPQYTANPYLPVQPVQTQDMFAASKRFNPEPLHRDVGFTIAFIAHFFVIAGVIYQADKYSKQDNNVTYNMSDDTTNIVVRLVLQICCVAVVCGFFWLVISRIFAKFLVWFTLLAGCIITGPLMLLCFMQDNMAGAIAFGVIFLVNVIIVYWCRSRVPFAIEMLKASSSLVQKYPATLSLSLSQLVLLAVYLVYFGMSVQYYMLIKDENVRSVVSFLSLVSLYWSTAVIKNIVHVTAAGTFSSWYFLNNTSAMLTNPTAKALKRTLTYSFGSVCFGSLLIAIFDVLRAMARQARNGNRQQNIITLCLACIAMCLRDIMDYFNQYAFVQVAVYGCDYITAAKRTWKLTKEHGVDAIINDSLVGRVLGLGCFIAGILTALYAYQAASTQLPRTDDETEGMSFYDLGVLLFTILGFVIGMIFVSLMMSVVDSCVSTLFVCYAEQPERLALSHPELAALFERANTGRSDLYQRV